jgi:drug/metabolite transporter (DMT)-like permease
MSRRFWTLLVILGAIWGASYLFIKIGIRDMSPAMVAWARVALAAVVLGWVAAARGLLAGFSGRAGALALIALIQVAGPFLLIAAGETEITSSLAGILVTSAPLFTAVLAIWVDHEERSQGLRLVGVMLGALGVVVLLGLDLGSGDQLLGGLAVVLAGLGYAVGGFMVKRRFADAPPLGVAAWVLVASTVLLAPAAAIGAPSEVPGLGPVAAVLVLGIVGTGVAFAIFYDLIATAGPARALIVTYLAPAFAVVYGAVLLDEAVTLAALVGLGLILAGSWLAAEGRLPSRRRPVTAGGHPVAEQGGGAVPLVAGLATERVEGR